MRKKKDEGKEEIRR